MHTMVENRVLEKTMDLHQSTIKYLVCFKLLELVESHFYNKPVYSNLSAFIVVSWLEKSTQNYKKKC